MGEHRERITECLKQIEPAEQEELLEELDIDAELALSLIREMLYEGELETTPEWKYEVSE